MVVAVIALMLVVAACGGKSAEEELLEQILESGGEDIGNVDISTDDDGNVSINVEGEDGGEMSITGSGDDEDVNITFEGEDGEDVTITGSGDDEDFTITVEGEDGNTMTFGGGEIPEGLTLPVPDGGEVITSFTSGQDVSVVLIYPATAYDQLVAFYENAITTGGDVMKNEATYTDDEGTHRNTTWFGSEFFVSVDDCYGMDTDELDSACVTINQYSS